MLRKLMKHELRATGRVMVPLLGLTLLAAVGGNIAVHNLLDMSNDLLNFLGLFLLMGFMAILAASFVVSFVLMIRRFYQNLLRDEGYLMMTLPVSVHEHVFSKLFVSLIWAAATAVTMGIAMFILVFELEFVDLILYDFAELLAGVEFSGLKLMDFAGQASLLLTEIVLLLAVAGSCMCLHLYAAMAVGHSFTHHKGLLSVLAYFALSFVWGAIRSGAMAVFNGLFPNGISLGLQNISPFAATHINMLALIVVTLIPTAIWYAITTHCLRNRLNLG